MPRPILRRLAVALAVVLAGVGIVTVAPAHAVSPGHVQGRVLDDAGVPLAGVTIALYGGDYFLSEDATTTSAADGTFAFDGVADGRYRVYYSAPAHADEWYPAASVEDLSTDVAVSAAVPVLLDDVAMGPDAHLTGTVTLDHGHPPTDDETLVSVSRVEGDQTYYVRHNVWVAAGTGHYDLDRLAPGTYEIYFQQFSFDHDDTFEYWDDAQVSERVTLVTLTTGEVRDGIDADLTPGAYVYGHVTAPRPDDPPGTSSDLPAGGVEVDVYRHYDDGSYEKVRTDTTRDDGSYLVNDLDPGRYVLVFVKDGYRTVRYGSGDLQLTATYGQDYLDQRLERAAAVTGRVTVAGRAPDLADVTLYAHGTSGWSYVTSSGLDAQGRYRLGDLPPGTYHLGVTCGGCRTAFWKGASTVGAGTDVVVARSQVVDGVSLDLTPSASVRNLNAPTIAGQVTAGRTARATNGRWSGPSARTYRYQWLLDDKAVKGATHRTFVVPSGKHGHQLAVAVTASAPQHGHDAVLSPPVTIG